MANDEYREQQQADRSAGLKARQATRQERAIRKQVAEEIAREAEEIAAGVMNPDKPYNQGFIHGCGSVARAAREIGTRETQP